jgi:putative sterol carrier protein
MRNRLWTRSLPVAPVPGVATDHDQLIVFVRKKRVLQLRERSSNYSETPTRRFRAPLAVRAWPRPRQSSAMRGRFRGALEAVMADARPNLSDEVTMRLGADPVLADFISPLPNLIGRRRRVDEAAFAKIADRLGKFDKAADVRITLNEGDSTESWTFELSPKGSNISRTGKKQADLELMTAPDVLARLASGQISPLAAFAGGRMRVRGDIVLARRIARALRTG